MPKNIRQEDGTRDIFVRRFQSYDKNESGDITLDEFLEFLADPTGNRSEFGQKHKDNSTDEENHVWTSQEYHEPLHPNRISVRSDDILPTRSNYSPFPPSSPVVGSREKLMPSESQSPTPPMNSRVNFPKSIEYHSASQIPHDPKDGLEIHQFPSDPQRPPLHKSTTDLAIRESQNHIDSSLQRPEREKRFPPPPTELGALMRIVLEGWLEKKSSKLGIWQKVDKNDCLLYFSRDILFWPSEIPQ